MVRASLVTPRSAASSGESEVGKPAASRRPQRLVSSAGPALQIRTLSNRAEAGQLRRAGDLEPEGDQATVGALLNGEAPAAVIHAEQQGVTVGVRVAQLQAKARLSELGPAIEVDG